MSNTFSVKRYLRDLRLPFCAGCGVPTMMYVFLKAVHDMGRENLDGFVFCSGIGCSSWISSPYFLADSVHTPHGRSIPVAAGIKLVRPEVDVVVFGGDGDIVGIGLSHFIHAARRNLDILVVMINNMVYGMTGGQAAPTTPLKTKTLSTPYGNFEPPLDAVRLAVAAGAPFSARWTTAHKKQLGESIKRGMQTEGFRFVEVVSQCPTSYGRRAGFKSPGELLRFFEKSAIAVDDVHRLSDKDVQGKIVIGEIVQKSRPSFVKSVYSIVEEAKAAGGQS